MNYNEFLFNKSQSDKNYGFEPTFIPDYLFDFQKYLLDWSIKKGESALFEDCGLGKSVQELVWGQNVVEKTNGNVLLLTPLAVGFQMEKEAEKFGIEAKQSRDGKIKSKITITNYEQLHNFDFKDFQGVICDESGILKNYKAHYKKEITIFMRKMKYRLLATATAAPNDWIELGTSSEALGYLGYMDMLSRFFKNDQNNCATNRRGRFTEETKWRLKGHAQESFWKWVTSWARAVRMPSDIGFNNDGFILPKKTEIDHLVESDGRYIEGVLPGFQTPAHGLKEERDETRATIKERCEKAAEIVLNKNDFSVLWCNLNDEGDLLEKLIPDSIQVSGRDSDERKEEKLIGFSKGDYKHLITKGKIAQYGMNWQHCNHMTMFPTHSYESYYQEIRRCWRFGQKRPVDIDLIYTQGAEQVLKNLKRKEKQASEMFDRLVHFMNDSLHIGRTLEKEENIIFPNWIGG
jgi:hypothetical protein